MADDEIGHADTVAFKKRSQRIRSDTAIRFRVAGDL